MTYELLTTIFQVTGIASAVMMLVTIGLFFGLHITDKINVLTGRAKRKIINEMIQADMEKKSGIIRPSTKKKQTKPAGSSKKKQSSKNTVSTTAKLNASPNITTGQTQNKEISQTAVLNAASTMTTVLDRNTVQQQATPVSERVKMPILTDQPFVIEFEITRLHTDTVI